MVQKSINAYKIGIVRLDEIFKKIDASLLIRKNHGSDKWHLFLTLRLSFSQVLIHETSMLFHAWNEDIVAFRGLVNDRLSFSISIRNVARWLLFEK